MRTRLARTIIFLAAALAAAAVAMPVRADAPVETGAMTGSISAAGVLILALAGFSVVILGLELIRKEERRQEE